MGFGQNPGNMIIGSIIPLIPGVPFTNGIRDLANEDYIAGSITSIPQDADKVTVTYPIKPEDAVLDLNKSAREVHDKIRALSAWPGCSTTFNGKRIKIYDSKLDEDDSSAAQPGEVTVANKGDLKIKCGKGSIYILELQSEGGKRLKAIDCAHNYKPGQRFGD